MVVVDHPFICEMLGDGHGDREWEQCLPLQGLLTKGRSGTCVPAETNIKLD